MDHPRPLFRLFLSFQANITILTTNKYEKCPSSIWCWDSNPQPLGHESPPITTRPGLPLLNCCQSLSLIFHFSSKNMLKTVDSLALLWPSYSPSYTYASYTILPILLPILPILYLLYYSPSYTSYTILSFLFLLWPSYSYYGLPILNVSAKAESRFLRLHLKKLFNIYCGIW